MSPTGRGGASPLARRVARLLVALASLRVPPRRRRTFRKEWGAELAAEARALSGRELIRGAAGAWADAGALARAETNTGGRDVAGTWTKELTVAVRGLWRTPGFTAVAVLTLALGLGGSAAVYSLLDRVVLAPLPYPAAERLISLRNQVPGVGPGERWSLSTAQWVHFTDHAETLEAVGLHRSLGGTVQTAGGPERVRGVLVTESVMGILGARARHGRILLPVYDQRGAGLSDPSLQCAEVVELALLVGE